MKSLRTLKAKAFTLIEMLVVLLIISVLLLLFVPNLTKQKDSVTDTGNRSLSQKDKSLKNKQKPTVLTM